MSNTLAAIFGMLIVVAYYYGKFKGAKEAFDKIEKQNERFRDDILKQSKDYREKVREIYRQNR